MTTPSDIIEKLLVNVQTLHMATLSSDHQPFASYAPYIVSPDGHFFVFISELAQHTRNLLQNNTVSILIIEDEQDAQEIFARNRLQYQCQVARIDKNDIKYDYLLNNMDQQFGETVALLKQLPDFHLFRFTPQSGNLVVGFGRAYHLTPLTNKHQQVTPTNLLEWQMSLMN